MDNDKIKEVVTAIVNNTLSEKERATALSDLQEAVSNAEAKLVEVSEVLQSKTVELNDALTALEEKGGEIDSLKSSLELANGSVEAAKADAETKQGKIVELQAEVDKVKEELSTVSEKFSVSEAVSAELAGKLQALETAARLEKRVEELESAGVLRKGSALDSQKQKISDLSDEEFASYKEDMVDLKKELLEQASKKSVAGVIVNPEFTSDSDIDKYSLMGQAMAKAVEDRYNTRR